MAGLRLDLVDPRVTTAPAPVETVGDALSGGFQSGMRNIGATSKAYLASGLEAAGQDQLASELYDSSLRTRANATRLAPQIQDFEQVRDLSTGMRYAAGQVGQGVGSTLPAIGAGALLAPLGPVAAFAGSAAAMLPQEAGESVLTMRSDPEAVARTTAGERFALATGKGAVNAGLEAVVPTMLGRQLATRIAAPTLAKAATNVAGRVGEAVVAEGATEGVQEVVGQQVHSIANPLRDTSGDAHAVVNSAIGGALAGGGMAAPTSAISGALDLAANKAKPAAEESTPSGRIARLSEFFKGREPVTALEHADATLTPDDTIDTVAVKDQQGAVAATEKASRTATKLMSDPLMAQHHEEIGALRHDDEAGQQRLAELNTQAFEAKAAKSRIDAASGAVDVIYKDATDGASLSEDKTGVGKRIFEEMKTPEWEYLDADTRATAADTVRKFMAAAEEKGTVSKKIILAVNDMLGESSTKRLIALHEKLGTKDPTKADNFYKVVSQMATQEKRSDDLLSVVRSALPPDMIDSVKTSQIKEFVAYMKDLTGERTTSSMTPNQATVYKTQLNDKMQELFGDKFDAVNKAFAKDALEEAADAGMTSKLPSLDELDKAAEPGQDQLTEQETQANFYGGGKDKANPEFIKHMDVHRAEFGNSESAQERLMRKAEQENPTSQVEWVNAKDYAKEHGISAEQLATMTGGKPENFGLVVARGIKDPDTITWRDIDAMRMDASKSSHYESKSRIDTVEGGPILDAVRIVRETQKRMKGTGDVADSSMQRMARALNEGIAAVSDHMGVALDVPDTTVVGVRSGGKVITAGDLRTLQDNVLPPAARKEIKALREKLATAKDEGAPSRAKVKDLHQQILDLQAKHPIDEASEPQSDTPATTAELKRKLNTMMQGISRLEKIDKTLSAKDNLSRSQARDLAETKAALFRAQDRADKLEASIEKMESREAAAAAKEADGVRQVDPEGQIHHAEADHKNLGETFVGERAKRGEGVLSNNFGKFVDGAGLVTPLGREAINSRLSVYEAAAKTAPARALVAKGKELAAGFDQLTPTHQGELAKIIKVDKLSTVAGTIESLHDKYKDKFAKAAPAPTVDIFNPRMAFEAKMAQVKRSTNAKGLQAALIRLLAKKKTNDPQELAAIAAINDRISILLVGNPDQAYNMLTHAVEETDGTRFNMQTVHDPAKLDAYINDEKFVNLTDPALMVRFLKAARRRMDQLNSLLDERELTPEENKSSIWAMQQFRDPHADLSTFLTEIDAFRALPEDQQSAMLAEIEALRGKTPKFSKLDTGDTMSTPAQRKEVEDYIKKVLGDTVNVIAADTGLYNGSYTKGTEFDPIPTIRVNAHSLNPMSTAYHESLHAWFDQLVKNGHTDVVKALSRAANTAVVRNQLRTLLKGSPAAIKQVEASEEERMAYMYQFYANGQLRLGDAGNGVMERVGNYLKKVFGMWTNSERAMHVMDYFQSGEYAQNMGDQNAVHNALMEVGRNRTIDHLQQAVEPLARLGAAAAGIGSARIRDTNIPSFIKIADLVRKHGTKEGEDDGFIPASGRMARQMGNKMTEAFGKFKQADFDAAFSNLQLKKPPQNVAQGEAMKAIRTMLDDMFNYMRAAGVQVGDLGYGRDYLPNQWDSAYIASHQDEFRAMIDKYIVTGQYTGKPDALIARLMRNEGQEVSVGDARPGNQHVKERLLKFIAPEDAAPFLEKDAMRVLTSYIKQGAKRAEWDRRFGIKDGVNQLDKMKAAAVQFGATDEQMKMLDNYLQGVNGVLGSEIKPETRKLFGQMMVYQNVRLLPLGLFSAMIDPAGIVVRGGTVKDAFSAMKRGVLELPRTFKKDTKPDEAYALAEDMGIIDNAVLQHILGASYGLNAVGNTARKINETFFKWNGMEQFNTSMRVAATEAAVGFIKRHGKGDFNEHSLRYMAELGLHPSDVIMVDGRPAMREADFIQAGQTKEQAEKSFLKMSRAVNQWVDGAVLRPDQSQKAIWMNDARFVVFAHMKQFAFAFQDTILKRIVHEAKYGNYTPAASLLGYIPVMLTADLVKGMIQGGGDQPEWKKNWDMSDYIGSAIQRAGLFGVGQFGIDAFKDVRRGGLGLGGLGGPTINQLGEIVSTVGGSRQFSTTAIDSMPANALWSGYLPKNTGKSDVFTPTELNSAD